MTKPPLSGIKVLELGELVAGPFIGTLLGEFGAEVIKVERPGRGDILRQFGPMVDGESLYWKANGRNKKSVVLDLDKASARTVL
ncbi:MAG: CoA transferase, partial [Rhodospirillaceae bacterium]|nr:CoA transferase [Rhodospirillaceae bacterium]